jgi:WD40 repeat protein
MTRNIARMLSAAVVGIALPVAGLPVIGAGTLSRVAARPQAGGPGAAPSAQLWAGRIQGSGFSPALAVSRDGRRVFVTGATSDSVKSDYITVGYDAATGARLWSKRYNGQGNGPDEAFSVAVSPDGRRVFVTGSSRGKSQVGYATIAYSAATGTRLWVRLYNGGSGRSVAVSPDGRRVFVTGTSYAPAAQEGYATVAYNAMTGAQLWVSRYYGPRHADEAASIVVSPGGRRVFVTGRSWKGPGYDYATVAYNAVTGARLWVRRYNGLGNGRDWPASIAVNPGGSRVFVTGVSAGKNSEDEYATVAYSAVTGAQLWVRRYGGTGGSHGNARSGALSVAVSPGGSRVFVTGFTAHGSATITDLDYATIAYNSATGRQLWVSRYNGPGKGYDGANSVAVSPSGRTVFVTGGSDGRSSGLDYATIAYNSATGKQLWVSRYNSPGNGDDAATAVVASSIGLRVFVTGCNEHRPSGFDYATIAYRSR